MRYVDLRCIELRDDIPNAVLSHPGMIAAQERNLLYTLAADHYSGNGCIVDAGVFLGASSIAFGYGLKKRAPGTGSSRFPTPIESFERGIVSPNFEWHAKRARLPILPVGERFDDILHQLIEPVRGEVNLHLGDLLDFDGDTLGGIEICFLDVLKTKKLTLHCMRTFFPRLLPGAYVVQQDYFIDGLPFIKYSMEMLSDHFEYIGEVCSSAVFRLKKTIDSNDLPDSLDQLTGETKLRLHRQSELRVKDPNRQYLMQLSRIWLLVELGNFFAAGSVWQDANEKYASFIRTDGGEYKPNIALRVYRLADYLERRRRSRRGERHRTEAGGQQEARALGHEAMLRFPTNSIRYLTQGEGAMFRRDWKVACEHWEEMRRVFPDHAAGFVRGAEALLEAGCLDEAEAVAYEAVERFPDQPGGYVQRAEVSVRRGDWVVAVDLWGDVRRRFPDQAAGFVRGAEALLAAGGPRLEEAEAVACEAAERFPGYSRGYVQRAEVAMYREDWEGAVERWEAVRGAFPDHASGYERCTVALMNAGRLEEAEVLAEEAVRRFPHRPGSHLRRAELVMRRGDWEGAVERWEAVRGAFPDHASSYLRGAVALRKAGRLEEAEALAREAVERFPSKG